MQLVYLRGLNFSPIPDNASLQHSALQQECSIMATPREHYESLLADIYAWSLGDPTTLEHAIAAELDAFGVPSSAAHHPVPPRHMPLALDLGCGHGPHLRELARRGCRVVGVDSSPSLVAAARATTADLRGVDVREADLVVFTEQWASNASADRADWIFCLGDTITHLPTLDEVERLVHAAARCLRPAGHLIITLRDYTAKPSLEDERRFIPVRLTDDRLLTCFIDEVSPTHIRVYDILHTRTMKPPQAEAAAFSVVETAGGSVAAIAPATTWEMSVSWYEKLRLAPETLRSMCEGAGLGDLRSLRSPRGMAAVLARRPDEG